MAKPPRKKKPTKPKKSLELSVVGMQHRLTPSTRKYLLTHVTKEGPIPCHFEREPENPHDAFAVKVILDDSPYRGIHIGYLPRTTAQVIGPALDENRMRDVEAWLADMADTDGSGSLAVRFRQYDAKRETGVKKAGNKRKTGNSRKGVDTEGKRV